MNKNLNMWEESARFLAGEMTEEQETVFFKWLEKDITRKNEFEKMKESWGKIKSDPQMNIPDSGKAWQKLMNRLENDGLIPGKEITHRKISLRYVRIAAGILLLLCIGIPFIYTYSLKNKRPSDLVKYEAKDGATELRLPDESQVILNEEAMISFRNDFDVNRAVTLTGEAFFMIQPDSLKPFKVNLKNSVITVLGTSFNIRETKEGEKVEVFVESGKVLLQNKKLNDGLILTPGQFARSDESKISYAVQDDLNYLSWKTKEFKFVDAGLADIIKILENAYHVKIIVEDPGIYDRKLTSSYSRQSIDTILETICLALDLKFTGSGKEYRLFNN